MMLSWVERALWGSSLMPSSYSPLFRFSRFMDDFLVTKGSDWLLSDWVQISGMMLVPSLQSMFMKMVNFVKFLSVVLECMY